MKDGFARLISDWVMKASNVVLTAFRPSCADRGAVVSDLHLHGFLGRCCWERDIHVGAVPFHVQPPAVHVRGHELRHQVRELSSVLV